MDDVKETKMEDDQETKKSEDTKKLDGNDATRIMYDDMKNKKLDEEETTESDGNNDTAESDKKVDKDRVEFYRKIEAYNKSIGKKPFKSHTERTRHFSNWWMYYVFTLFVFVVVVVRTARFVITGSVFLQHNERNQENTKRNQEYTPVRG